MPFWKNLVRHLKRVPDQVIIEDKIPEKVAEAPKEDWEYGDPYFALGLDFEVDLDRVREEERRHQERLDRVYDKWIEGQAERELLRAQYGDLPRTPREHREVVYTFEDRNGPMAPYSAVLVPRPLTRIEQEALAIADMLDGVQVKGALKKKVNDLKKGTRRVLVQPNGKLKEVKKRA